MKNSKLIIGALLVGGIAYLLFKKKKSSATTDATSTQRMAEQGSEESAESEESGAMGGGGGGGAIGGGASSSLGSGNVIVSNSGVGVGKPMNPNIPSYKPKPRFKPIIKPTFSKPTFSQIPSYKPKNTFGVSPITLPKTPQGAVAEKTNFLTFDGSFRQSASHFFDGNLE